MITYVVHMYFDWIIVRKKYYPHVKNNKLPLTPKTLPLTLHLFTTINYSL